MSGLSNAIEEILRKIYERDSLYAQTWKQVPVQDLIAVARLKTFRATAMLAKDRKEKLLDDLIDSAAYLIFAIQRIKEEMQR